MSDKRVLFIRHKLEVNGGPATFQKMWDDRVIVLDYAGIPSADPALYKGKGKGKRSAEQAMKRLQKLCQDGAIVAADYARLKNGKMLIGEISAGSKVEIKNYDGYAFYKTVKFNPVDSVKEVSYCDLPVLLSLQPRQGGVLSQWSGIAAKVVESIYYGRPLPQSVYALSAEQLEVLSYEYLREKGRLRHLLMPIGRTIRDIDILGIDDGNKRVVAQVTFETHPENLKRKITALAQYLASTTACYFFSPAITGLELPSGVTHFDIESVFSELGPEHPLISAMLGRPK